MDNILSVLASGASAAPTYSDELERRARANGFPNAEAMMAWARQRNTPTGGTIPKKGKQAQPSVEAATSWHPANIFNYILGRWKGAADGN